MAEPEQTADEAPPKKSKKKLFIIIGVVVLLVGGGAGAWLMTQGGHRGENGHDETKFEQSKPPIFLPLDTFTVNLQGGEQYLQTDITLQVTDPEQADAIKLNMPRVRSRLLGLLSSKNSEDLATPEDKKKLALEIKEQISQPFYPKGKPQQVDDVLFTTFVIQ